MIHGCAYPSAFPDKLFQEPMCTLKCRDQRLNTNFFFSNFSGTPGIYPSRNPGTSRQRLWFPWLSRDMPNFSAPTPSRGRPPPDRKISGPKSLASCSFSCLKMPGHSRPKSIPGQRSNHTFETYQILRVRPPGIEWENGPKPENGKKNWPKKLAHGPKWPKNGEKNGKNAPKSNFSPCLGHCVPISGGGPFSIFRPFFPIFGFRPVFHSMPGGLTRKSNWEFAERTQHRGACVCLEPRREPSKHRKSPILVTASLGFVQFSQQTLCFGSLNSHEGSLVK